MNFKAIFSVIGQLLLLLAVILLLPAALSLLFHQPPLPEHWNELEAFLVTAALAGASGIGLRKFLPPGLESLRDREGFVIVALSWVLIPLFSALPFYLTGILPSFTHAYFEAVSGYTATGATVLTDFTIVPKGLMFWRSMTQWLGGMGIIMLYLSVFPALGLGSFHLFKAEIPGGDTVERMEPRLVGTAKLLWKTYLVLTAAEVLLLSLAGMSFFDAVCQSFSTVSTGGFSPYPENVGHFNDRVIERIILVFMVLAAINFAVHHHMVHGELGVVVRNPELRMYLAILGLAIGTATWVLWSHSPGEQFSKVLHEAAFTVTAINTTTGFTLVNFDLWPGSLKLLLLAVMMLGGCSGSTSGSIKSIRLIILLKIIHRELMRLVFPNAVVHIHVGGKPLDDTHVFNAVAVTSLFLFFSLLAALLLALMGVDAVTAGSATLACITTTGPGLGGVSPAGSYAVIPDAGKWILILSMLMGRLEIASFLILFMPRVWKK